MMLQVASASGGCCHSDWIGPLILMPWPLPCVCSFVGEREGERGGDGEAFH